MREIKSIADDLACSSSPVNNEELVIKVLSSLGPEYKELSAAIRARDNPITFEELFDKLVAQEMFIKHSKPKVDTPMITAQFYQHSTNNGPKNRQPNSFNRRNTPPSGSYNSRNQFSATNNNSLTQQNTTKRNNQRVQCQLCDKFGHIAKVCRSKSHSVTEAYANFVNRQSYASNSPSPWVVDSGASHHITNNSHSLQTPTEFSGTDAIIVGDGKRILVTHIGHTTLSSPNLVANFLLKNDLSTGACLLQGKSNGDLYEWPTDMTKSVTPRPQAHFVASTTPSLHLWHARLGHPQPRITKACVSSFNLPVNHAEFFTFCNSCLCNKSHRLPFGHNSITSFRPFDVVYSDVWGPSPTIYFDNFRLYIIFVDHFTKYTWLFLLKSKSNVKDIFINYVQMVQNQFQLRIKTLYTDGGGEYIGLKSTLLNFGIQHLISPPYTP
ncbi:hypothetical protein KY289_002991 [Solanum tuberosum]|nr:hypothetical protein KY289_002991 [Solanum tuberosum]